MMNVFMDLEIRFLLNKRGYDYINWNTDDPSPHLETYKSLYKSIPFIICLIRN